MALCPGTKLGRYEITGPLGAGGMGEVYRAKDTRLDRTVAIKILPAQFSSNPVRKQRFEREAKTISSLNHPHICVLHDVGHQDGIDYLVMECVEGETLAKRLEKGPLPLEQVLKFGTQIADALDKAHRSSVVHRDLKPGNIMLTPTGAKLLDFGLAKPVAPLTSVATLTAAVTQSSPMTEQGAIVGTFQYMSPEQVEGKELDGRSDIFSLGAVLYEMVTGQKAFQGKSQLSVASAILEKEPAPINSIKPMTPPALDHAIRLCLAKDPEQRRQTAHDVFLDLDWISKEEHTHPSGSSLIPVRPTRQNIMFRIAAPLAAGVVVAGLGWMLLRRPVVPSRVMRFAISLPAGEAFGGSWWWFPSIAVSPDGSQIAYVAHRGGASQIYLRSVGDLIAHAVPGTEGAEAPFSSPDGRWLGIDSGGTLKKIPLAGGPPITISTVRGASNFYGACWAPDDTIYFGGDSGLLKVPATGGESKNVTTVDAKNGETEHRFPEILPGGKALLFALRTGDQPSFDDASIAALTLATGERKILVKSGTHPHYISTGHLVFLRAGVLLAVSFDPVRLETKGTAMPVIEKIIENPRIGAGQYTVSSTGSLFYIPGGVTYGEHELVFVDKAGNVRSLTANKRPYEDLTISPDGRFIATTVEGPVTDTWIHDIARDTETRFTFGVENRDPVWMSDGKRIAYNGFKKGKYGVFWKPLDGSGPEEPLLTSDKGVVAWFWSRDGRLLLYSESAPNVGQNFGILPMDDREHRHLLFPPQYNVDWAVFSPDGHWIAFSSDESGRQEVYVAPYPSLAPEERISAHGGLHPLWAPNGRELYYRTRASLEELQQQGSGGRALAERSRVMAVSIETRPEFKAGRPRMLFEGPYFESGHDFAITPDGRGFILIRESESEFGPKEMHVVLNWFEELKQRVPD
jgi:eukaryotic-like serine/threonine-protein kinase